MVALLIRDATNTARTITALIFRDATNTPRTITELWIRDTNNVPRLVYNPSGSASLAVAISASTVAGTTAGSGTATTGPVTATPSGGTGPYTYAWTQTSAPPHPTVANAPTSATTDFTMTGMYANAFLSAWTVTVTDSLGNTAVNYVTAIFTDIS